VKPSAARSKCGLHSKDILLCIAAAEISVAPPAGKHSMSLAVLVYVDNKKEFIEELGWLYRSMLASDVVSRGDLIAVCHPDVLPLLPTEKNLVKISAVPYSAVHPEWADYGYINSIANLCDPNVWDICKRYDHVLKSDCDTFVAPALKAFEPSTLCFGFGAYAYEESVRRKLSECSARWGFPHSGLHNVGASVLGPTEFVHNFVLAQLDYCHRLLADEFKDFHGQWPGWCKNVLTMYAGELALRRTYPQQCSLGLLDHVPYLSRRLASDVLHIHAWHTDQFWSKHAYRKGEYANVNIETADRNSLGGYCHWLATSTTEEIRQWVSKSRL
jgi:hypothetical protein